jgi:hypothetical protein
MEKSLLIQNQKLCLSWGLKQTNKFLKFLLALRPICLRFVAMGGGPPHRELFPARL